jgi:hypothetical protein
VRDRTHGHREQKERAHEEPAPTRVHDRPYLNKQRFSLVHQVHNLDDAERQRVITCVGELRRTIEPSFEAVVRAWDDMEKRRDLHGELACAFLWSSLEQQQRKRAPAPAPPQPLPSASPQRPAPSAGRTSERAPERQAERPTERAPERLRPSPATRPDRAPDRASLTAVSPDARQRPPQAPREPTLAHLPPDLKGALPPIQARHVDRLLDPKELPLRKAAAERAVDVAKTHLRKDPENVAAKDVLAAWQKETARELAAKKAGQPLDIKDAVDHPAFASLFLAAHRRTAPAPAPAPTERVVPPDVVERRSRPLPSERERQMALERLKALPEAKREQIVAAAHGLMLDGKTTRQEARETLPAALDALKRDASREHAIHALTLTAIANVRTVDEYLSALEGAHPRTALDTMRTQALVTAQNHADEAGLSLRDSVASRFVDAALRDAVSGEHREDTAVLALVLDALRQQDAVDPAWEDVGRALAGDLEYAAFMRGDDASSSVD